MTRPAAIRWREGGALALGQRGDVGADVGRGKAVGPGGEARRGLRRRGGAAAVAAGPDGAGAGWQPAAPASSRPRPRRATMGPEAGRLVRVIRE